MDAESAESDTPDNELATNKYLDITAAQSKPASYISNRPSNDKRNKKLTSLVNYIMFTFIAYSVNSTETYHWQRYKYISAMKTSVLRPGLYDLCPMFTDKRHKTEGTFKSPRQPTILAIKLENDRQKRVRIGLMMSYLVFLCPGFA